MEINNGIIIDGVLYESSEGFCNECSLYRECCNILDDTYCSILDLGIGQCFVSRGKVTEIIYMCVITWFTENANLIFQLSTGNRGDMNWRKQPCKDFAANR